MQALFVLALLAGAACNVVAALAFNALFRRVRRSELVAGAYVHPSNVVPFHRPESAS